jgi:hypothetical protein
MTTQRRCRSSDYTTVGVNHGAPEEQRVRGLQDEWFSGSEDQRMRWSGMTGYVIQWFSGLVVQRIRGSDELRNRGSGDDRISG